MHWQLSKKTCPKCGSGTRTRACVSNDCTDGYVVREPRELNHEKPGLAFTMCFVCMGTAREHYCTKCSWNLRTKSYDNGNVN